jgi:hypothetical protein
MMDFQETCFGHRVSIFRPLFILSYSRLQIIIIIIIIIITWQPLALTNKLLLLSMWSYVCRCVVNQQVNSVFKLMLDKATGDHTNFLKFI